MSYTRYVRGTLSVTTSDPQTIEHAQHRRRHRALPRTLVARSGPAVPRHKKTTAPARLSWAPRISNVHEFGDGRTAVEFDGPSIDLMLYHDQGTTIAEWVTVDGELLRLVAVGDC